MTGSGKLGKKYGKYSDPEIIKSIRLTSEEAKLWNPDYIREYLSGKFLDDMHREDLKRNNIDTTILKKMIPAFVKASIEINLEQNEIERVKELYAKI